MGLVLWLRKTIIHPLLQILRRGAEPKQLSFSAALGITFGLFPICGVTVFLCGMAIALLRSLCHAPTVMLANFVATPIELSLIIFFLRFGEFITGGPHFPLTSDALKKLLTGQASREILRSIFNAAGNRNWWSNKGSGIAPIGVFLMFLVGVMSLLSGHLIMPFPWLLGWLVAAPFILAVLYILFLPCFAILVRKFSAAPTSPKLPLHSSTEARIKVRDV